MSNTEDPKEFQLIVFEGSDWCANCIRLEKNILSDTTFTQYLSNNNIALIKIDFPQKKKLTKEQKKNNALMAEKYNFQGTYPSIVLSRTDTLFYNNINYKNQSIEEIKTEIQQNLMQLK